MGVFAVALWRARPRDVLLLSLGGAVLFAGLVVTFSRSSALMLMAALAIIAWRAFGPRATAVGLSVIVLVGAIGGFAGSGQIRRAATDFDRLEQVSEGRFGLIRGGLDIWREHPVRGGGLGSFADRFSESLDERSRRRTRVVISHNTPVTVLAEGGSSAESCWRSWQRRWPCGWWEAAAGAEVTAGSPTPASPFSRECSCTPVFYSGLFEDPYAWVVAAGALALHRRTGDPRGPDDMSPLRVLIVTGMWPSEEEPDYGAFVRTFAGALARRPGVEVDVAAITSRRSGAVRTPAKYAHLAAGATRRARRADVIWGHYLFPAGGRGRDGRTPGGPAVGSDRPWRRRRQPRAASDSTGHRSRSPGRERGDGGERLAGDPTGSGGGR